ncbi:MAG: DUF1648 domain-containing protein [bacterium]|nr:DUF1648 domain-containing protein [bacterium]
MKSKKSRKLFALLVIGVAAILGITGWFVLPDQVVTQIGFSGEASNTMPKFIALILPFLISLALAVPYMNAEEENKKIWFSLLGPMLYVITFIVNL